MTGETPLMMGGALADRVRTELFANLCHYRQGCISERSDAETVAEFIEQICRQTIEEAANVADRKLRDKGYDMPEVADAIRSLAQGHCHD